MKLKFRWVVKNGRHQNGESVFLNRIKVGMFDWNDMRSRDEPHSGNDYICRVLLPSLKEESKITYSSSREEARIRIEQTVTSWFIEATSEKPVVSTVQTVEFDTLRAKLRGSG